MERKLVQKQVQISAAEEAPVVLAEHMAFELAVKLAMKLIAEQMVERRIAALAAELMTAEMMVSDHKVDIDSATAAW